MLILVYGYLRMDLPMPEMKLECFCVVLVYGSEILCTSGSRDLGYTCLGIESCMLLFYCEIVSFFFFHVLHAFITVGICYE